MDAALTTLWDRGVHFSYDGEPFRSRQDIPNENVHGVNFSGSHVSDADIESILLLQNVASISFWKTAISDRAIELIANLPQLAELNLCGTSITDACVPTLITMPLEYLDVAETRLTADGITQLRAGLPEAEIRS